MQIVKQGFEFVIRDQAISGRLRRGGRRSGGGGDCRQGIGRKGAFAVQLVEQRFEFVVGDVGADRPARCGRCRSGSGRRHRISGELAFAMQLVEQRFEFCVGNVFAGRRRCRGFGGRCFGFGLDGTEGVEQLFELSVRDIRFRLRHRLRRRFNHRRASVRRLCIARQGRQQFRRGRRDRGTFTHLAEHAVDRIQCFENHVHQLRINVTLTLAQDVEHVLGDVAALHQLMELEEAGAPFYSVKTAKNCIEQVRIIRAAFQLDQLLGQLL
ncbi:hypothetical protein [Pseudomonas sp. 31 E 5]|nr:hypothetical protein [Pseudomonas sp. 31 E 5]